jgi:hypothetical protein
MKRKAIAWTRTEDRPSERGLAMITAIMILSFLTIVGAAMLGATRVDVMVTDNYRTHTQLQYLVESGIEAARDKLRIDVEAKIDASTADSIDTLDEGISAVLSDLDGADGLLSTSLDADTLLDSGMTDDVPYLNAVSVVVGGETLGTYSVFLRNDNVDGQSSPTDTNEIVTLVSIGVVGDSTRLVETVVRKGRFPTMPSALTLNGDVDDDAFGPGSSNGFAVFGNDAAGGPSVNGVGVTSAGSAGNVVDDIAVDMPDRSTAYQGEGTEFPNSCLMDCPDVGDISSELDGQLTTASGMEALLESMKSSATHRTCPAGNWGTATSPRVTYVSGNCIMNGNDTGWGLLVVEGALTMGGNVIWNGLVIVVDRVPCDMDTSGGTHYSATLAGGTVINGGLYIANLAGNTLINVCIDISGGGTGGVYFDSDKVRNASTGLPFTPISVVQH